MKIGVSSYSFKHYMQNTGCDYLKICDIAKEIGFEAIEFIDLEPEISGKPIMETAKEIHDYCEKIGLEVTAYTVKADFLQNDAQEQVEHLKECVDVAAILGVKVMRHDCTYGARKDVAGYTWHDAIDETAPYIRTITEYAAQYGIKTCVENHGRFMQDSNRVEALIRTVNHKNFGWLVDVGNFICADEDSIRALGTALPYAIHIHMKDFLYKSGSGRNPGMGWIRTRGGDYVRGTIIGNGIIPIDQCVFMLKQADYRGSVSIEFEGLEENLPALQAGLAYLRACLAE